jgi:hypothetical protein
MLLRIRDIHEHIVCHLDRSRLFLVLVASLL